MAGDTLTQVLRSLRDSQQRLIEPQQLARLQTFRSVFEGVTPDDENEEAFDSEGYFVVPEFNVADLVGWWPLDHAAQGIRDRAGSAHGTVTGSINTWEGPAVPYIATEFDGDSYVRMGDVDALDFDRLEAFSIGVRVRIPAGHENGYIVDKRQAIPVRGYGIQFGSAGVVHPIFTLIHDTLDWILVREDNVNDEWDDDEFHTLVVTYDGSGNAAGVTMYKDGAAVAVDVLADTLTGTTLNTGNFSIGRSSLNITNNLEGYLADLCIWDKELSAAEAQAYHDEHSRDDMGLASYSVVTAGADL